MEYTDSDFLNFMTGRWFVSKRARSIGTEPAFVWLVQFLFLFVQHFYISPSTKTLSSWVMWIDFRVVF